MGETEVLSAYLASITYEDISERALQQAKLALLDWLGVCLRGSLEKPAVLMRQILRDGRPSEEATVLVPDLACGMFGSRQTTAWEAALFNGMASHTLDFDDLHNASIIHLATVVMPAALALAETRQVSGKELLKAIVVGYEGGARIGESILPEAYYFWHTTGTVGALAAAAASGAILALSAEQMAQALGSAGTQAAGLWEFLATGAMSKSLHAGKAAQSGVLSALLAEAGFTGAPTILEGEKGFCRALGKNPKLDKLTASLGHQYKIEDNSLKPYPCCKHSHAFLYACELWRQDHDAWQAIEKVRLGVNKITDNLINNSRPQTAYGGKFSLQYCVAVMLRYGKIDLGDFTEEALQRRDIRSLMEKIQIYEDSEIETAYVANSSCLGAKVELLGREGTIYEQRMLYPKGDPTLPLSWQEVVTKVQNLLQGYLKLSQISALCHWVETLEAQLNVSQSLQKIRVN